jgi:hypothetical protein
MLCEFGRLVGGECGELTRSATRSRAKSKRWLLFSRSIVDAASDICDVGKRDFGVIHAKVADFRDFFRAYRQL